MSILSRPDYAEVRTQLDVSLDEGMLPDRVIEQDAYVGEAERQVLARDPEATTRIGNDARRVRLATIYLAAARLVMAVPQLVSEQTLSDRLQWQRIDPEKRAAQLRAQAEQIFVAYLSPTDSTAFVPTLFTTAPGYRGRLHA